ncbi:MAG: ribonuclease P protein component [Crocinitomicaceae bacterium]|jgi:ribonuclease P protein component|nr:ribonuclease P protein component [Crocinitomicaceae bacterium]
MVHTFRKSERLCSRTVIDEIFSKGKELRKFPYLLKYIYSTEVAVNPVQIVVSVPKKRAKSAVDRNRLRRQIKEAYRLNKDELQLYFQNNKCSIVIFLIYTGKEKEVYTLLEEKLKVILKELIHTVSCLK